MKYLQKIEDDLYKQEQRELDNIDFICKLAKIREEPENELSIIMVKTLIEIKYLLKKQHVNRS